MSGASAAPRGARATAEATIGPGREGPAWCAPGRGPAVPSDLANIHAIDAKLSLVDGVPASPPSPGRQGLLKLDATGSHHWHEPGRLLPLRLRPPAGTGSLTPTRTLSEQSAKSGHLSVERSVLSLRVPGSHLFSAHKVSRGRFLPWSCERLVPAAAAATVAASAITSVAPATAAVAAAAVAAAAASAAIIVTAPAAAAAIVVAAA